MLRKILVLTRSIKAQLILKIGSVLIVVALITLYSANVFVTTQFNRIETDSVKVDITRIEDALKLQSEALATKMGDWAAWDDAYKFMIDGNTAFEVSSLAPTSILTMKLDTFIWRRSNGEIRWAKECNLESGTISSIDEKLLSYFVENSSRLGFLDEKLKVGIFNLPGKGASLVGIFPVVKSSGEGPIVGTLIVSRSIGSAFLERMSSLTKLNIKYLDNQNEPAEVQNEKIKILPDTHIAGYAYVRDYYSNPAFTLWFEYERSIYKQGQILLFVSYLFIAVMLFGLSVAAWFITDKVVVSRILLLLSQIRSIDFANTDQKLQQLPEKGHDEITLLTQWINRFLKETHDAKALFILERAKALHHAKLASLGEMSAGIAHEINNPLAVISGNIPLLLKFKSDDRKFSAKLDTIAKSAIRIEKIVKGLKKFSRSSTGSEYKPESIDTLVSETLIITEAKSKRHSVPIVIDIAPDLNIKCDSVEIEQVLVNLINNGIDAVKVAKDSWVKIHAFSEDRQVVVQVIDSGLGISPEIEQKLFQPFFTTKAVGEGTGLGLSIAKGILDSHKATFELNQSFRNTCFEIRFAKIDSSEVKNVA